jgi:hypothetical protein
LLLVVVDAAITIGQTGEGPVGGKQHFTVQLRINPGTGWQPAAGAEVTVRLTDGGGADHVKVPAESTCGGATDGTGSCRITFTSATAGTVTGNARATLTLWGVTFVRDTNPATAPPPGPGGSGPATRTFVAPP